MKYCSSTFPYLIMIRQFLFFQSRHAVWRISDVIHKMLPIRRRLHLKYLAYLESCQSTMKMTSLDVGPTMHSVPQMWMHANCSLHRFYSNHMKLSTFIMDEPRPPLTSTPNYTRIEYRFARGRNDRQVRYDSLPAYGLVLHMIVFMRRPVSQCKCSSTSTQPLSPRPMMESSTKKSGFGDI